MSEKHVPQHNYHESYEHPPSHELLAHAEKQRTAALEQAHAEKSQQNIDKIRKLAKAEAQETHKVIHHEEQPARESWLGTHASLKATAYIRTLTKIQHKLPKPARTFSKLVHNPALEKISNVSAQTIARPSGLLGGSIVAFLGSTTLLYLSKYYGYRYNYTVFFVCFIGGFLIGAMLELLLWLVHGRKKVM